MRIFDYLNSCLSILVGINSTLEDWRTFLTQTLTGALAAPHDLFRKVCDCLNPLTPKISLVILLTVCHTILVMLVWRIWYWINL